MLTGKDLRQYRKRLGMTQVDFARQFGIAQATLSQIESGRIALSDEHVRTLAHEFSAPHAQPGFAEYQKRIEQELSAGAAALQAPSARYTTLVVWAWEEGFDLGRVPPRHAAVDLVTIAESDSPAVALKFNRASEHWQAGEILVFEKCGQDQVEHGDLCLLQLRPPRRSDARTLVAIARLARLKHGRVLQFEPVSPAAPVFAAEDAAILTLLRAVYSARRLK